MTLFAVILHTTLAHTLTQADMPPGVFSQSPNPEQIQESVQYYSWSQKFKYTLAKYI
jgi:hypothetical protein